MTTARDDVIQVLHDICSRDRHYEWYVYYLPHAKAFLAEFSQEEQDRLELFTQFYESRLRGLPQRFETLMTDVQWNGIKDYAAVLLDSLASDKE